MSCQPLAELSDTQKHQLACNLAILLLHDEKSDITSENITRILKASGLTVPAYWPNLMSKALSGKDVSEFLTVSGGGGGSGPNGKTGGEEAEEPEKEPTEEEEEDVSMGGLFD